MQGNLGLDGVSVQGRFCQFGQTETPCKAIWFKQQIRAGNSESLCQLGSDLGASPRRLPGRVR